MEENSKKPHGNTKHGKSGSKEYNTWMHMRARCENPKLKAYKDYGGRGISVCERWLCFENFLQDMGQAPSSEYSIDRIDNDKNYQPGNCRWATRLEQLRNTSRTIFFEVEGKRRALSELCEFYGVKRGTVYQRLYTLGWTIEEALGLTNYKPWSCGRKT